MTADNDAGKALDGFADARVTGNRRLPQWLERHMPRWVLNHGLLIGWLWTAFWVATALTEEIFTTPVWVFEVAITLMMVPSIVATALCLWATPRDHLRQRESILTHFVARFTTVFLAFFAWTLSIVIGASISSAIQLLGSNKEAQVLGIGFTLVATFAPMIVTFLWLGLVFRSSWFLVRLRGWHSHPKHTDIPKSFLSTTPRLRIGVVSLAHPALLIVGGIASVIGSLMISLSDATLTLFS